MVEPWGAVAEALPVVEPWGAGGAELALGVEPCGAGALLALWAEPSGAETESALGGCLVSWGLGGGPTGGPVVGEVLLKGGPVGREVLLESLGLERVVGVEP